MKNNLIRSVVFIVLGVALLMVSIFAKSPSVEKWSSFALGASFPMLIGGLISLTKYFMGLKQPAQVNS
jgi:hypothetical protein